eukprot:746674_1
MVMNLLHIEKEMFKYGQYIAIVNDHVHTLDMNLVKEEKDEHEPMLAITNQHSHRTDVIQPMTISQFHSISISKIVHGEYIIFGKTPSCIHLRAGVLYFGINLSFLTILIYK